MDIKEEKIKLENITLKNFLYGICEIIGNEFQSLQNRLVEVAQSNGTDVKGGILTSLIHLDENTNIATMQIGILTAAHISNSYEFTFEESFVLNNVVCFNYRGKASDFQMLFNEFINKVRKDADIKLEGKIYNLIRYLSKSDDEIDATIYMTTVN